MLRRKFDVVTIGGATRDIMFYTSDGVLVPNTQNKLKEKLLGFEYGAKIIPESLHQVLGGGATNAAVSFARLGLRVGAFVRLGRDRDGDAIEAELRKAGVKTRFIERDSSVRTGFSFFAIHSPTKEHVAFLHRGANDNMRMSREELRQARTQ
ncbi:MAG: carbohydrate kinase family protein, partial [bacterium]|nr:carbohydrate kinase family protein [bacterium]